MKKPAWNRGVPCSEKTKLKLSRLLTGRVISEQTKEKMRLAKKFNPVWNKGVPCAEGTRRKWELLGSAVAGFLDHCRRVAVTELFPDGGH